LIIFILCAQTNVLAQSFSLLPPAKAGFEMQVSAQYQPDTRSVWVNGSTIDRPSELSYFGSQMDLKVRKSKRNIFAVTVPLVHNAERTTTNVTEKSPGRFSNIKLDWQFLLLEKGILAPKSFIYTSALLVVPSRTPVINPSGLAIAWPSYALELGLAGGRVGTRTHIEGRAAMGFRPAQYSHYLAAFGRFSLPFQSITPALTLDYHYSLSNGTYRTPPNQAENGLYTDQQRRLLMAIEMKYGVSRFWGVTGSLGKIVHGHQVPNGIWLGLGVWLKWG
jgi:hypothetical protein